jgi:hypothetical protein
MKQERQLTALPNCNEFSPMIARFSYRPARPLNTVISSIPSGVRHPKRRSYQPKKLNDFSKAISHRSVTCIAKGCNHSTFGILNRNPELPLPARGGCGIELPETRFRPQPRPVFSTL